MIAGLKPYSSYQDAGLSSFGSVPTHWNVMPIARVAALKSIVNQPERQLLSVYLQRGVVRFVDVEEKRTNVTSQDLSRYQVVDPGDFALNNQQAWRGSVGVSPFAGIVSPAYLVLSLSEDLLSGYANFLFRDHSLVAQYLICSKGVGTIQRNLYWPHLKRVEVVMPPPADQAAIVRFLNWVNARIERAIRTKRKMIALLNEQKQAIIHHAVTRGISASVALKPSGIELLGDVPHHWDVALVKHVADVRFSGVDKHSHDHEIPVRLCNYTDVYKNDQITDDMDLLRATATAGEIARLTLKAGDVIITKDSETPDDIAVPAWVPEELPGVVCAYHLGLLRPDPGRIEGEFLFRAIGSARISEQFHVLATGVTRFALSKHDVKNAVVALPPVEEQKAICKWIDDECKPLEDAILRAEEEINLLQEYRTRLVADVVTGKLDVREAAAKLPNDISLEPVSDLDLGDDAYNLDQEANE